MAHAVCRRCVEIVDAGFERAVDEFVYRLLVESLVVGAVGHAEGGEAHTAIAEDTHGVARVRVGAVGHGACC